MSRRSLINWIFIGIVVLLAVAVGALYWRGYRVAKPTNNLVTPANQAQNNQTAQPAEKTVKVFFIKSPDSINDPTKLFAVDRSTTRDDVEVFAIDELLKGPTQAESDQGYQTNVGLRQGANSCGGDNFTLKVSGSTATLQFCLPFDHIGELSDARADQQIKQTLGQFADIKKVIILNYKGDCEFDLSGMNLCKQ